MSEQSIPPGLMFRSFLTVASGYVLTKILFLAILLSIGFLFFPEFVAWFNLEDKAAQEKMMADNPQDVISVTMFYSLLLANVLACFGVGWLVAKTAPFAQLPHAIFLAMLMLIDFMQIVVADPADKKWMDIIYMAALPIAILIGANSGRGQATKRQAEEIS